MKSAVMAIKTTMASVACVACNKVAWQSSKLHIAVEVELKLKLQLHYWCYCCSCRRVGLLKFCVSSSGLDKFVVTCTCNETGKIKLVYCFFLPLTAIKFFTTATGSVKTQKLRTNYERPNFLRGASKYTLHLSKEFGVKVMANILIECCSC